MSAVLVQPERPDDISDGDWRIAKQLPGLFSGESAWAAPLTHTGLDDDSAYALTVFNNGSGGHINVPGIFTTNTSGVDIGALTVSGTTTLNIVNVSGLMTLTRSGTALVVNNNINVLGSGTFATVNVTTSLNAGDGNADAHTFVGVTTFRNLAGTATQLYVDAGNNRVIVGSGTTLGSDTTPNLQVIGRLYVAPESANDTALQLRRSSAATVGWTMGVENSPVNLAFKDDSGTKVFTLGDAADTYQAVVTGAANVTTDLVVGDDVTIAGDVSAGRGVFGSTTFSGSEELRVVGQTRLEGATEITTGGMSVVGGAIIDTVSFNGTNTVFSLIGTTQTQSTVGAAGGSSALPANPSAYLKIVVGATNYVIPFYNA